MNKKHLTKPLILKLRSPEESKAFNQKLAKAFGLALREVRKKTGISQENLALISGIERSHYGRLERGLHAPTFDIAFRVSIALEVSVVEIVKLTEQYFYADDS